MRRWVAYSVLAAVLVTSLLPADALARRRTVVVRRHIAPRTTIVIHRGFPLLRPVPRMVIVRPARTRVLVAAPLVYLAPVVWAATVVPAPPRPRLVWQDTETIVKDEEWVECNFGVDSRGMALYLQIQGKTQLNFAEVTFGNGQVQVVDFQDRTRGSGVYRLLDFADGREVKTVRILARARSDEAKLKVYMLK